MGQAEKRCRMDFSRLRYKVITTLWVCWIISGRPTFFMRKFVKTPLPSPKGSEDNPCFGWRDVFRGISDFPGQNSSSPPIALEGDLRNGGSNDQRTKKSNHRITTGRIWICHHCFLAGPDEESGIGLLPQKPAHRHQSGCAYRGTT